MAKDYTDPVADAKAALSRTEDLASNARASAKLRGVTPKPVAASGPAAGHRMDEQPRGMRANVVLRRSLTSKGRR